MPSGRLAADLGRDSTPTNFVHFLGHRVDRTPARLDTHRLIDDFGTTVTKATGVQAPSTWTWKQFTAAGALVLVLLPVAQIFGRQLIGLPLSIWALWISVRQIRVIGRSLTQPSRSAAGGVRVAFGVANSYAHARPFLRRLHARARRAQQCGQRRWLLLAVVATATLLGTLVELIPADTAYVGWVGASLPTRMAGSVLAVATALLLTLNCYDVDRWVSSTSFLPDWVRHLAVRSKKQAHRPILGKLAPFPHCGAALIWFVLVVGGLTPAAMNDAPLGRGTGLEGYRRIANNLPWSGSQDEQTPPPTTSTTASTTDTATEQRMLPRERTAEPEAGRAPEPRKVNDECPDSDAVKDQIFDALRTDPKAAEAVHRTWYRIGSPTLGCPDDTADDGSPQAFLVEKGFYALKFADGAQGSALIMIQAGGPAEGEPDSRTASVVFAGNYHWVLEHLDELAEVWDRQLFTAGEIQVFRMVDGSCEARERVFPAGAVWHIPGPVFEVINRLGRDRDAVPTLRSAPKNGVFVFAFAHLTGHGEAERVTTSEFKDVVVRLEGDVATGGDYISSGEPCSANEVDELMELAARLERAG